MEMELRNFLKQPMTFLGLPKTTYGRIGFCEERMSIGMFLASHEEVKKNLTEYGIERMVYDIRTINRKLKPYGITFGVSELEIMIRSEFPNSILLHQLSEFEYAELCLTRQELLYKAGITKVLDLAVRGQQYLQNVIGYGESQAAEVFLKTHGLTFDMSYDSIELYCIAELIDQKMDAVLKQCTNIDTSAILSADRIKAKLKVLIEELEWLQKLQNIRQEAKNLNVKPSEITEKLAGLLRSHHYG